jgi:hypothetical protein
MNQSPSQAFRNYLACSTSVRYSKMLELIIKMILEIFSGNKMQINMGQITFHY